MRLLFLTAAISVFFVFTTYHQTFAQINIPTQFSTYTNEEYNIEIQYPSGWQIFGDRVPGDYVTDIAVFVPSSEISFKKYDSYKDFRKLDMSFINVRL